MPKKSKPTPLSEVREQMKRDRNRANEGINALFIRVENLEERLTTFGRDAGDKAQRIIALEKSQPAGICPDCGASPADDTGHEADCPNCPVDVENRDDFVTDRNWEPGGVPSATASDIILQAQRRMRYDRVMTAATALPKEDAAKLIHYLIDHLAR